MYFRILATITLALMPVAASAGDQEDTYKGQGYAFYGYGRLPGGDGTVQQIGGGGNALIYKGLAAGGEIGFLYPTNEFAYGIGVASINASYYLTNSRRARLVPFVTGGYSLAFRGGHMNLSNFGGGVTWWATRHFGIRAEIRDYLWPEYRVEHSPQLMLSFAFR